MSWELRRLDEVCEIQPKKAEVKTLLNDDESVSFMGMDMLGIDEINAIPEETMKLSNAYKSYTYFQENDVLLAKITPCFENGKLGIAKKLVNGIGFGSSEFTVYRCDNELLNKYLYYFLKSDVFRQEGIRSMSGAVGHKRVKKEYLTGALIPLPPLPVQKQIVEKLDAAFADIDKAISATEKNIENAEALFQQTLNNFFTINDKNWISSKFIDVLEKTGNINPKDYPEKTFTYVDISSVSRDLLIVESPKIIQGKDAPSRARKLIKTNNIIFSTVRPTLKRIAIIEEDLNNQVCSTGFYIFQPKEILDRRYIYYFLQTSQFINIMEKIQTGASYPAVTNKQIEDQVINFPKLEEQKEITQKLDYLRGHIKKLVSTNKSKLMHLNSLKSSILNKAFSGELTKDAA